MLKKINYLKSLPKIRSASGVLLFNKRNQLLILKPSYKDGWIIPGGVREEKESPLDCLHRELKEEINLQIKIDRCLAIDYKLKTIENYHDESLQFIFLAKKLTKKDITKIKTDQEEIMDFKFLEWKKALSLIKGDLKNRLKNIDLNSKKVIMMENGKIIN